MCENTSRMASSNVPAAPVSASSGGLSRGGMLLGCALSLLSGMGFFHGVSHRAPSHADRGASIQNPATWSDAEASVPIDSNDPIWGSRYALVTVVVFSDFECPFCALLEKSIAWVKEHYDPKEVRIVWKHDPLPGHEHARPAAIAGETVFRLGGSRAFWSFAEAAFEHQEDLDEENFADWAEEAGVSRDRFVAAFRSKEFAAKIDADLELGVRLALTGAPMILVNGVLIRGAASEAKLAGIIDQQMERAKELRETTPADQVYVRATQENRAAPAPAPRDVKAPPPIAPLDKTVYPTPLDADDVVRGPSDAAVTIVVFGDFGPSMRTAYGPIDRVVTKNAERVRLVFRPRVRPTDEAGWRAANMLYESRKRGGDAGFWAAYARLLEPATPPDPGTVANDLHLDIASLDQAIKSGAYTPTLSRMASLAADLELPSMPALFVNGRRFTGPPSDVEIGALVDEELAHAAALTEAGTPADQVYASILAQAAAIPPPEKRDVPPPAKNAPWRGDENARVVVQVFVDLQSPYSKRARVVLADLERAFAGAIKVVFRHRPLPIDKDAILAAEAALEAQTQKGNEGFWKFVDAVFNAQGRGPDALSRDALVALAKTLGFDAAAFDAALASHVHRPAVEADARAADEAGIGGVPSYSVNGWFLAGNVPLARLERAVDLALRAERGP